MYIDSRISSSFHDSCGKSVPISPNIENTIENIGRLGRFGMRETDREIIRIMTGQDSIG